MPRGLIRFLIRSAGLIIVLIGVGKVVDITGDFGRYFKPAFWGRNDLWPIIAVDIQRLQAPLTLCMEGAAVFAVAAISLRKLGAAMRGRLARFDFNAKFAPYIVYDPAWRRTAKWVMGALFLLVGGALGAASQDSLGKLFSERYAADRPMILAIGIPAASAATLVIILGLRMTARRGERSLRGDRREPFLYLRSFATDARMLGDEEGPLRSFLALITGGRYDSYERQLVTAVADIGPLVAIGKPDEKLPPLGAARIYIKGDDWQRVVTDLVDASRAVFLRIGTTQGFWWELKHIVAHCDPRKVIICLPRRGRMQSYRYLRANSDEIFPKPLPEWPGNAMFLGFHADWEPRLLPNRATYLLRRLIVSRAPEMRDALNDALSELGVWPKPMPLVLREYIVLIVLMLQTIRCVVCPFR